MAVYSNKGLISISKIFLPRTGIINVIGKRIKHTIDKSLVPVIDEKDLEEKFIKGSGPGGSNVNKTINCVQLIHKPTGIVVKAHISRLLQENRKIARELLTTKLDNLINGEKSVENQIKAIELEKRIKREQKRKKIKELRDKWKEGLDNKPKGKDNESSQ